MDMMLQMLQSMENSVKLNCQARAERRAEEAERDRQEFQEKLMHAAENRLELDRMASKIKGTEEAVRRDQLIGFMMAGF